MDKQGVINYFRGRWPSFYEGLGVQLRPLGPGKDHVGICPFHDDHDPSFMVNPKTGLFHCFGCHIEGDAFTFWGRVNELSVKTNFPEIVRGISERFDIGNGNPRPTKHAKKRVVAKYNYTDENGKLLFQVLRYDPKEFNQRRPDGEGGWT